jgi:2-C-methyl-D-erythritol 4-phosphate cytidylyltransferase
MKKYALIVAGGSGIRMGFNKPKQFLHLAGKPVLMHTIEKFYSFDSQIEIIVILAKSQIVYWEKLIKEFSFDVPHKTVAGGAERFYSVKNGLSFVIPPSLVAIHDGVRPLISIETIKSCFETASLYGNSVPSISPSDSLRIITDKGNRPLNREFIKLIQTPQVFDSERIIRAYNQEYSIEFTDDASVFEKSGEKIILVEGNPHNIKITTPVDLIIAEELFSST